MGARVARRQVASSLEPKPWPGHGPARLACAVHGGHPRSCRRRETCPLSRAHHLAILHPHHGDVLNRHDGEETRDSLLVEVRGVVPSGARVTVNGVPARLEGEAFTCAVPLCARKNEITAVARQAGTESRETITILWDKCSRPRYRFSVDDNIEFLKDLGTRPDDYPSLFDHWYAAFWRRMHEEFGAKIHLNIYYQTVTRDFTLRQMPEKWRDEWEANSDWLHLSFHALQDQPPRIYRDATYGRMAADYDLVVGEIRRFAGHSVLSTETTVHWAEAPREACRALYDRGIRVLIAIFRPESGGECTTGYYLPESVKDHANTRDCYYDPDADLLFVTEDATVNSLAVEEVEPWLDRQGADPHTGELMELLIHEQYFRKELPYYQPSIEEKVVRCLRWVTARGHQPVFWGDGFLGNPVEV